MSYPITSKDQSFAIIRDLAAALSSKYRIRINTAYSLRVGADWGFGPRINRDCHMIFVRDGGATYDVEGEQISLRAGDVLLLGPGVEHSTTPDTTHRPFIIPLRWDIVGRKNGVIHSGRLKGMMLHHTARNPSDIETLFRLIYHEHTCAEAAHADAITSAMHLILYMLTQGEKQQTPHDPRIHVALEILEKAPETRFAVGELAEQVGLSEKYFARRFRSVTGHSVQDYAIRIRIRAACHALEETNLAIKTIAGSLGYPDPFAFSRQFRQITGNSPRAWRNGNHASWH